MKKELVEELEIVIGVAKMIAEEIKPGDSSMFETLGLQFDKLVSETDIPPEISARAAKGVELSESLDSPDVNFPDSVEQIKEIITFITDSLSELEAEESDDEFPFQVVESVDESAMDSDFSQDSEAGDDSLADSAQEEKEKFNSLATEEIIQAFIQNFRLQLDDIESIILELEKDGDTERIEAIQRFLHNMKGESSAIGLKRLPAFLHELETVLNDTDKTKYMEIADGLLFARDKLQEFFNELTADDVPIFSADLQDEILSKIDRSREATQKDKTKRRTKRQKVVFNLQAERGELLDFVNETMDYLQTAEVALLDLESYPDDKQLLNEIFRSFHNIKGISGFLRLKDISTVAHATETVLDMAREGKIAMTGGYVELCFDSIDMLKEMIEIIDQTLQGQPYRKPEKFEELLSRLREPEVETEVEKEVEEQVPPPSKSTKLGELLESSGLVSGEDIEFALVQQQSGRKSKLGEILLDEGRLKPRELAKALRTQKQQDPPTASGEIAALKKDMMVKVNTSRLDFLIDAVGELVISNSMVIQEKEIIQSKNQKLTRNIALLTKITRELQEIAMSMRMVSLKTTFQKMSRIARDLSVKSNVPVEFSYSGEDTELDRNVVEEIGSPLVHMVRNAVDHGIEKGDERKKTGKPETGHVHLSAAHEGGNVVIRISDDGSGLNKEKILAKALKQGLISEKDQLTDKEIYTLIFKPGFSTADKVTDVSGRGVGMDVVRKAIDDLHGRIEIDSTPGEGATFSIYLPLTLAIIDGMIITVGAEKYIIPTLSIIESLRPLEENVKTVVNRGEMLNLRGNLIPLFRLHTLFGVDTEKSDPWEALVVVITGDGKKCALMVDDLVTQQQIVIKSLGKTFASLDGVSGGAIMGDGRVALILDAPGIVRLAHSSESKGVRQKV